MSYIRSLSNPEGLYIFGDGRNIELIVKKEPIKLMPPQIFKSLMLKWLDNDFDDDELDFEGAKLKVEKRNENFKWILSYADWQIEMWEVTLFYVATSVKEHCQTEQEWDETPLTQEEFNAAHQQWYQETAHHSFPWTILRGKGYEKIKSFGQKAIPFLLAKLKEENVQTWGIFAHLTELTGEDIFIGEEEIIENTTWRKGQVDPTIDAWLKWGRDKGYLKD